MSLFNFRHPAAAGQAVKGPGRQSFPAEESRTAPHPSNPSHGADREKADEIERRYGGNLFQPSADERALIDAAAPYLKRDSRFEHDWNRDAIDTLRAALPLPTTISDAIAEWKRWNALCSDRQFVCRARRKGVWESQEPVQRRMQIVADIAGRELPASTLDDLMMRLRFLGGTGAGQCRHPRDPARPGRPSDREPRRCRSHDRP